MGRFTVWLCAFVLAFPHNAIAVQAGIKHRPLIAYAPVNIMFTLYLDGDPEEMYCPGLEWEFGDGSKSGQESDCEPYSPEVEVQTRHTAQHAYGCGGEYNVKVRGSKGGKTLFVAATVVTVNVGLGC